MKIGVYVYGLDTKLGANITEIKSRQVCPRTPNSGGKGSSQDIGRVHLVCVRSEGPKQPQLF